MKKNNTLGFKLRVARANSKYTTSYIAEKTGISEHIIYNIENGRIARPKIELLQKLADFYGIDSDELIIAAGKVPQDIYYNIVNNPDLLKDLREFFKNVQ